MSKKDLSERDIDTKYITSALFETRNAVMHSARSCLGI